MSAGCLVQGVVGPGSLEMHRGGSSTARLKSGAETCWEESRLRRAEILALPSKSKPIATAKDED
jgi:hypothetical protein